MTTPRDGRLRRGAASLCHVAAETASRLGASGRCGGGGRVLLAGLGDVVVLLAGGLVLGLLHELLGAEGLQRSVLPLARSVALFARAVDLLEELDVALAELRGRLLRGRLLRRGLLGCGGLLRRDSLLRR